MLEGICELLEAPLHARGVVVLNMESKENLRVPNAVLASLGITTYLVADGDWEAATRKYPDASVKQTAARSSNEASTARLISWLPESEVLIGETPLRFGGPTTVARHWTLFCDDIERELAEWPTFLEALSRAGGQLHQKSASAYRSAIAEAKSDDLPASLRALCGAISCSAQPGNETIPGS